MLVILSDGGKSRLGLKRRTTGCGDNPFYPASLICPSSQCDETTLGHTAQETGASVEAWTYRQKRQL
jgi:hypothetical protein